VNELIKDKMYIDCQSIHSHFNVIYRMVCTVLKDVIFFIAESDSNHHNVDPLDFVVDNVSRDRQKLLREQSLLKFVFEILEVREKKKLSNPIDI
jgi:hypothetical protein